MKLFIQVGCVIGLVAPVAGIDSAFAQCIATAKPDYMTGSPPKGPRTPLEIAASRTDSTRCDLVEDHCAPPTDLRFLDIQLRAIMLPTPKWTTVFDDVGWAARDQAERLLLARAA